MRATILICTAILLRISTVYAQPSADDLFDDMISTMVELDKKVEITTNINYYDNTQEQRFYTYTLTSDKFCVEQAAGITIMDPDSVLMISEESKVVVLQHNTNVGSLAERMEPFKKNIVSSIKEMKNLESRTTQVTTLSSGNYQLNIDIEDGLGPFSSAVLIISSSTKKILQATYAYTQGQFTRGFGGKDPQTIEYLYNYTAPGANPNCNINSYIVVSGGSSVLTPAYSTYTLHNLMGGQ